MPLPNLAMDAVPFTPLTAEFLDNMIENIEALANGSGLNTNAVTASKLATNAITLGYAQITSTFSTTSGTAAQVTGLTTAVTIPAGGRRVRITVNARSIVRAGTFTGISIWDGTVGSGTRIGEVYTSVSGDVPATCTAVVTPAAGAKTYNAALEALGGGTAQLTATASGPASILVQAI